jgi:gamma-glutamylcyclotransferase (GGCT)/AIG2-like uncharacterized protein YtfP
MADRYMHKVFVYGSLLSNLKNHHILTDLNSHVQLISNQCITAEEFYLTGLKSNEYPYLSEVPLKCGQKSYKIRGELYEVSDHALAQLDWFEEHPIEYCRSLIDVQNLSIVADDNSKVEGGVCEANIYLLKNEERIAAARIAFDTKFVQVDGGDWREHLKNS